MTDASPDPAQQRLVSPSAAAASNPPAEDAVGPPAASEGAEGEPTESAAALESAEASLLDTLLDSIGSSQKPAAS